MSVINKLQALGIDDTFDIPLPKIVLIGDQSAGKSSQIEALSEIKVPRADGTCTRCVLHISLSTAEDPAASWRCNVSLLKKFDYYGEIGTSPDDLGPWHRKDQKQPETIAFMRLNNKDQLELAMQQAQMALLNPGTSPTYFSKLDNKVLQNEADFSPNEVHLEIQSPELPNLDFYDLPGIINEYGNENGNESHYKLPDFVRALATEYMNKPNAIIMLARAMSSDPQTSSAGSLVNFLKKAPRTIGVVTKPDRFEAGANISQWEKILAGSIFKTGFGYFVTKQPAQEDLKRNIDHATARQQEREFFATTEPWCTTLAHHSDKFGTARLSERLSQLLAKEILSELPSIKRQIDSKLEEVEIKLQALPSPPPDNCLGIVMSLVTKLQAEVTSHMVGEWPDQLFVNSWREQALSLRKVLVESKPTVVVRTPAEPGWKTRPVTISVDLEEDQDEEGTPTPIRYGAQKRPMGPPPSSPSPAKRQRSMLVTPTPPSKRGKRCPKDPSQEADIYSAADYDDAGPGKQFKLVELEQILTEMNTSGIPGQADSRAVAHLIELSRIHWPSVVKEYLDNVDEHLKVKLTEILDKHLKEWSAMQLDEEVRGAVEQFRSAIVKFHRESIGRAIRAESLKPFTSNHEMHEGYRVRELEAIKKMRHQKRQEAYLEQREKDQMERPTEAGSEARQKRLDRITVRELGEDPHEARIEVVARVRAYYLLAADYMADHIAKSTQYEVFWRCRDEIGGEIERALHLTSPDAFEYAKQLLAEDPAREAQRIKLRKEREQLIEARKSLATLDLAE